MKCKYCKKGNELPKGRTIHAKCKPYWDAEHIPKNQKKRITICPHCYESFEYWQLAYLHAVKNKHWGDYTAGAQFPPTIPSKDD